MEQMFEDYEGETTMNDDMPWVDLTPEEIQQLRANKQQLTEYGKHLFH